MKTVGDVSQASEPPRLRTNPHVRLVPDPATLPGGKRHLGGVGDQFGLALVEVDTGPQSMHAIDCDTALLLYSLMLPGTIPEFAAPGTQADPGVIRRLLLDELLEIETATGGFVHGHDAVAIHEATSLIKRQCDALSWDALRWASRLPLTDSLSIVAALYSFHCEPNSSTTRRIFGNGEDTHRTLCLDYLANWRLNPADGWWILRPNPAQAPPQPLDHGSLFKLYVSPKSAEVLDVIPVVARTLAGRAVQFKVGRQLLGVLRPDKIVAYFTDRELLAETAEELAGELVGVGAHGVPFTAPLGSDRLLSWAADPPRTSWRHWVCSQSAEALLSARPTASSPDQIVERVLQTLAALGVNLATFSPIDRWDPSDDC
jgi:hypothetical protein